MDMRLLSAAGLFFLLAVSTQTNAARESKIPPPLPSPIPVTTDCSTDTPFGAPSVPGSQIKIVCKSGYVSYFDLALKIPRFVGYVLTSDETFGCLNRYKTFHVERDLPPEGQVSETDYRNTQFDLGHNASDQDMATNLDRLYDSFSMANITPQRPKFNREGWESLEQDVRDWAWTRGTIIVYVGSVIGPAPTLIGRGIAVPDKFYKIVIDPAAKQAIGFLMPHQDTPKGDMSAFRVPISQIETESGITFPVPDGVDKTKILDMWPNDDRGWHQAHKQKCHSG